MRYILIIMSVSLIIIAHNLRSTHNVGALLRTADGLGIEKLYFTGYTPYPHFTDDERLPHISERLTHQINKTALGAQDSVVWEYAENIRPILTSLRAKGYKIAGLEQAVNSIELPAFKPPSKLAILLGSEVTGIDNDLLNLLDYCLEIPMAGKKESFNVVEAATMAMYHCLCIN